LGNLKERGACNTDRGRENTYRVLVGKPEGKGGM